MKITEYRIIDTQGRTGFWSSEKRMAAKLHGHAGELKGYSIERREQHWGGETRVRFAVSELDLLALAYDGTVSPL